MYQCPECALKLTKQEKNDIPYWGCRNCQGHLISFPVLRKVIGETETQALWDMSSSLISIKRPCPSCTKILTPILHLENDINLEVDICRRCRLLWLDQGEIIDFENIKDSRKKVNLTPEEMKDYANSLAQMQSDVEKSKNAHESFVSNKGPEELWKWLPALVGLPVEIKPSLVQILPIISYFLTALAVCVFILTSNEGLIEVVTNWGFVPADPFRASGMTLISSFFLHIGFFHILGNMYFLMTFGDDVEQDIGSLSYLWLVLLSHIGGVFTHMFFVGAAPTPLVGASAGVFGVMAYYMVRFPHTKVGVLFLFVVFPVWLRFSAKWLFIIKIGYEFLIISLINSPNASGVAHAAHFGGALVGIFWGLSENYNENKIKPSSINKF